MIVLGQNLKQLQLCLVGKLRSRDPYHLIQMIIIAIPDL